MGSDQPKDVGWWLAADGRYYPPQLHPNYASVLEAARLADEKEVEARRSKQSVSRLDRGEKFTMFRIGIVGFVLFGGCGAVYSAVAASKMPDHSDSHGFNRWVSASFSEALRPLKTAQYRRTHLGLVVDADSPVNVDDGEIVASDDFSDPAEGWLRRALKSGDSYDYDPEGYVIHSEGNGMNWAFDPSETSTPQGTAVIEASLSSDSSKRSGRGTVCTRGGGGVWTTFGLSVSAEGQWRLLRTDQTGEDDTTVELESGFAPGAVGRAPVSVALTCAVLPEEDVVRVVGFVAGDQVIEVQSRGGSFDDDWSFGVLGVGPESTAHFNVFELRDLTDDE